MGEEKPLRGQKDYMAFLQCDRKTLVALMDHGLPVAVLNERWYGTDRAVLEWLRQRALEEGKRRAEAIVGHNADAI